MAPAATPVVISPVPKQQFLDNAGRPLAFGCLFAYQSGTTTLLTTYTDATGTVANTNPIILDASGRPGSSGSSSIFLAAGQAYTIKVKTSGGVQCASGTTLYTIDGIGGGLTLLTTLVTCNTTCSFPIASQIQLFEVSLTGNAVANPLTGVGIIPPAIVIFEITQDSSGGHTFTWPANSVGGATVGTTANQVTEQMFVWDGTTAIAIGPGVSGNGPELRTGAIFATGNVSTILQLISTVPTGTAPIAVSSTTKVANLNVDLLDGFDWAIPGAIGSTTPNSGIFTTLEAQTSFKLHGSTVQTDVQGSDPHLLSAGTFGGSTGDTLCRDANGGATDQNCGARVTQIQSFTACASGCTITMTPCTTSSGAFNSCDNTLTWPVTFGSAKGYAATCVGVDPRVTHGGAQAFDFLGDITTQSATQVVFTFINSVAEGNGVTAEQINCIGIKP